MDAKNTIVTSFVVVVCSFVLLTAIALFMSSRQQQPKVDPIIDYLNEIHNRPTQPFGGQRVPFDNTPEIHEAESKLPMIRKLHLVRPDLINYPLYIETYC